MSSQTSQHELLAGLEQVRQCLLRLLKTNTESTHQVEPVNNESKVVTTSILLEHLCSQFNLTEFERCLLLLCLGYELDASFVQLCGEIQGGVQYAYPTLNLALKAFPNGNWNVLAAHAPLRYWRLIDIRSNAPLAFSALRISERIFHYLLGANRIDHYLMPFVKPLLQLPVIVPSHQMLVEQIVSLMKSAYFNSALFIQLMGKDLYSTQNVAQAVCRHLEWQLITIDLQALPADIRELECLLHLFERETILSWCAYLLVGNETSEISVQQRFAINYFCERLRAICFVCDFDPVITRAVIKLEVAKPTLEERKQLWKNGIESYNETEIHKIATHFDLNAAQIQAVHAEFNQQILATENAQTTHKTLWEICRKQAAVSLQGLAEKIHPKASWQQLVLPESQMKSLREIVIHFKQRHQVYYQWGFANKYSTGLGIGALFSGSSGTGKSFAAEIIANELGLDLYRIDLSTLVSKYIGETEKNLKKIFDTAESSGAVLLFDEADAIFGKRSEVKDSHDRYANLEISYLLQKMEAYRGLVILTTNLKNAIDSSFLRRLRFVIQFPFPNQQQRAEIWRRIFPAEVPQMNIGIDKLARLNLSGGNIRNIAMNSAFLAASEQQPVQMKHLLRAAESESAKLEISLTETEVRDWV